MVTDKKSTLTAEWRLLLEGEVEILRVLDISTAPDNEGYVRAVTREGTLLADSPPMTWKSSLAALQDYLSHLKLSLRILSLEEDTSSYSGKDPG